MKKLAFTLIALLLAFALTFAACGETPDPTEPAESESGSEAAPAEDDSIEEATAGMPNPMEKLEGPAKFEHDLGFTLDAPEGAEAPRRPSVRCFARDGSSRTVPT